MYTHHFPNIQKTDKLLERISTFIFQNRSYIPEIGLINGKMGIAIFYYQYSRYTGNSMIENYAVEMIKEIYDGINIKISPYFTYGLTGIGWGIEYLDRLNYIDCDRDFAELDNTIYRQMQNNPILLNTGEEFFGFGFYHVARLTGRQNRDGKLDHLLKEQNLNFLTDVCERLLIHKKYLDFDTLYLPTGTINSLLWFFLEIYKLKIFPVKIKKLLLYLPEFIGPGRKENEMPSESIILHSLANSVYENFSDEKIRSAYKYVIKKCNPCLRIIPECHNLVSSMAHLSIQNLIYQPYSCFDNMIRTSFDEALNIIDNEEDWNKKVEHTFKYNLGLSGLAGLGLYLLTEVKNLGAITNCSIKK